METKLKYSDITERIIDAFYIVYNTLGYGFSESYTVRSRPAT